MSRLDCPIARVRHRAAYNNARMGNAPRTPDNLLSWWNEYTSPYALRTDHQHKRCAQAARAIDRMIAVRGIKYIELSSGARIPA